MDSSGTPEAHDTPCVASDREVSHAVAPLASVQDGARAGDVKKHLVEMLSQDDIDDRVIQKGVRIVYVGQEYSNMNYLIRHRARNEAVHHFPANQISRQYTSHELDRIPREAFTMPCQAVVDELLENYFLYVNPGFPILDEQIFMSQYRNRDPSDPPSLLVLQAVLLVGAHVSRNKPDRDELKTAFFRRAKMLFDARFEWNRDVVVQAALLLTWHSEGVEDIGANSYYWVGVAARTAQGLGMHRDTGPSTLVPHDKRLWRRIWWILVQFDSIVSLSYGRPQAINLDDSDVPVLQASDFDLFSDNIHVDFILHQTSLCCIISKALRENFGLTVPPTKKRAGLMETDQKLAKWMASLPTSLIGLTGEPSATPWVTILHITYNNFLVLLHRPPPKPASMATVFDHDDMKICSAAVGSMIGLFETVVSRNELRFMNVFAVDALFTTLIQLSAEIRVANPLLSAYAKRRFDSALDALRSLAEYWLNAESILRLFEDSSERMQQELRIGKTLPTTAESFNEHTVSGEDVHSQDTLRPGGWESLISSPTTALQRIGVLNDQLDWTNMYWENSGFTSLSPFTDVGLYQNPPS
ncbi:Fc.00g055160.m01.CDS01 [Cosmosporella sp. VM-42]